MNISGTSTEFPLPELLQMLDQRQVTGCLSLSISSPYYAELLPQCYDIWLSQGHVVALQHQPHDPDIYTLAIAKKWISGYVSRKLRKLSPKTIAAGLYLESQGVLNFDQLRSLFFSEVIHRLQSLCQMPTTKFEFGSTTNLPISYMTGLAIAAATVVTNRLGPIKVFPFTKQDPSSVSHKINSNSATHSVTHPVTKRHQNSYSHTHNSHFGNGKVQMLILHRTL
ncbi:MAG: DUF4388 domain-containing protein [Cyanothece sp. SIO2G6]|nr:DUF4388 domain-containing protein [Cyanothece sp. SIO2G6]